MLTSKSRINVSEALQGPCLVSHFLRFLPAGYHPSHDLHDPMIESRGCRGRFRCEFLSEVASGRSLPVMHLKVLNLDESLLLALLLLLFIGTMSYISFSALSSFDIGVQRVQGCPDGQYFPIFRDFCKLLISCSVYMVSLCSFPGWILADLVT
jgi:hypothetical protein